MVFQAALLWVVGLFTLVPYGTYYLFVHATRDQYALLITLVGFWIFGYWGVVGPLLIALRVRALFSAIERAQSRDELAALIRGQESRDLAIDFIAAENRLPRFVATRVYDFVARRLGPAG
jgi:hypothetical protein